MSKKTRVGLSGTSSFTGYWIARVLHQQGFEVLATCSHAEKTYTGLRKERLNQLNGNVSIDYSIDCASESILNWISEKKPEIWINHHFYMHEFRKPEYDTEKAEKTCIKPLNRMAEALAYAGCKAIVYSGTYIEPGETRPDFLSSLTPYSLTKAKAWNELKNICTQNRLLLSKVVIPNVIGPMENEDRLIPVMIQKARKNETLILSSPNTISDNIPASELAKSYANVCEQLLKSAPCIVKPSGWICDTESLVEVVSKELIINRLKLNPLKVEKKEDSQPKMKPKTHYSTVLPEQFWDGYAEWAQSKII